MQLTSWQWALLSAGAFVTGLSKTGVAGLGVLAVALFANALPARESTGALLPLLLCADVFGVAFFRKHASWPHLWKLFPWVVVGVVAGYLTLGRLSNLVVQRMIGGILLAMIVLHLWRQRRAGEGAISGPDQMPHTRWFGAMTGVLAGFTTMVANAAGPVMILYLLALGLPKLVFIGTGAWFYMCVNAFKVPFSVNLGLITQTSLGMDALLLIPMVPGALLGPLIVEHINQRNFERMALVLTALAAARLLV
ncbi:MAG TPA: sulfite exporter TauE/SafE family protein [Verrucomicrobiae bacterium]